MKNILKDTTGNENNNSIKNGFVLESKEAIDNIVVSMNVIYELLLSNTDVSEKYLQEIMGDIERDFENTQINLYGQKVDIEFMRKNVKEMKENKKIWEEILAGNISNHRKLTFLIDSVAEILIHSVEWLFLDEVIFLTDKQAEIFRSYEGLLYLNGIIFLTDNQVESLSKHQRPLSLDGLISLTDNQAESFSRNEGDLSLSGLKSITEHQAEILSRHKGTLFLNGLSSLTYTQVEILSHNDDINISEDLQKK